MEPNQLSKHMLKLTVVVDNFTKGMYEALNSTKLLKGVLRMRCYTSWRMQNKNGQNNKSKARNQVALKGRGCRTHKGLYPTRGKGRTAHGRR